MGCEAAGEENALFDSGPLRPTFEKQAVLRCDFGFQSCDLEAQFAPSLCGGANLYRLADPEQRLSH
jgi:hypothetical protein